MKVDLAGLKISPLNLPISFPRIKLKIKLKKILRPEAKYKFQIYETCQQK